jgi:hypothetical protein
LPCELKGFGAIVGFAGNKQILGFRKNLFEALPHNGVVISNKDVDLVGHG